MAELDYAYLAEYAKVGEGLLTAVGASYTFVRALEVPSPLIVYVAGRVRTSLGEAPMLGFTFESPQQKYRLSLSAELSSAGARPYSTHATTVGTLFVASAPVLLSDYGLYTVTLELDGSHARTLRFEVEAPSS